MTILIRSLIGKFTHLFNRRQTNADLEDEIQLHIQMPKERFTLR